MAFDITPYIDMKPAEVRKLIREGVIDFPTAGMCRGYAQANLVILPPEYAADFEEFAKLNPFPCPILEIIKGTPETHAMGVAPAHTGGGEVDNALTDEGADLCGGFVDVRGNIKCHAGKPPQFSALTERPAQVVQGGPLGEQSVLSLLQ